MMSVFQLCFVLANGCKKRSVLARLMKASVLWICVEMTRSSDKGGRWAVS